MSADQTFKPKKTQPLEHVRRWKLYLVVLSIVLFIAILVSLNLGYSQISFTEILKILSNKLFFTNFSVSPIDETIIIWVRLPRIICAAIVGAALSVAGIVYQGIFRNPMAEPYTIGASSGAALGATLAIVLGVGVSILGANTTTIFAFIGCLATVLIVYIISRVGGKVPVQTLLLSGIAIGIFISAIVNYLQILSPEKLHQSTFWLLGSFSFSQWNELLVVFPLVLIGIIVIYLYSRDLNLLALGEDEAQHLGVNVERMKKILLLFSALITAAAVSISGIIAFIGLIIPHIARILIGPDHRILLSASLLLGATFLVLCDSISRIIVSPAELPVGIITALCGGPFFLYLMSRKKKKDIQV